MGLSHGARWWWEYFRNLFFEMNTAVKGSITLSYGMQALSIPIDPAINPKDIYLNCVDNGVPVCIGNVSMAMAVLNDDHTFTLNANVQSNSCTVNWLIEYEPFFDN